MFNDKQKKIISFILAAAMVVPVIIGTVSMFR